MLETQLKKIIESMQVLNQTIRELRDVMESGLGPKAIPEALEEEPVLHEKLKEPEDKVEEEGTDEQDDASEEKRKALIQEVKDRVSVLAKEKHLREECKKIINSYEVSSVSDLQAAEAVGVLKKLDKLEEAA